jgi:hypothetical protein
MLLVAERVSVRHVGIDVIQMKWWVVHMLWNIPLFVQQRFVKSRLNRCEEWPGFRLL